MLLAIDPAGLKGIVLQCESNGKAERWLELFTSLLPENAPHKRIPSNISEERLLGGLDFAASIALGKAVAERGVFAEAAGGSVVLTAGSARRATFTHLARTLDAGRVVVERDGLSEVHPAVFATVAFEADADERVPLALSDRLAFLIDLGAQRSDVIVPGGRELVAEAKKRLGHVSHSDATLEALTVGATSLGILSCRAVLLALVAARAHAALKGHAVVEEEDIACAARLVLAPRAADVGAEGRPPESEQPDTTEGGVEDSAFPSDTPNADERRDRPPEPSDGQEETTVSNQPNAEQLADLVVRSAAAALAPGMLAAAAARASNTKTQNGRAGAEQLGGVRGRQVGTRRGDPRGGARLDLVATLRAAVPFQRMRNSATAGSGSSPSGRLTKVELRRDDFRIKRCISRSSTTTLFVVDASGSAALARLAEAKGAVELLLAEGYARRDRVAVIAFRGTVAELVLPATHALARARRAIAGMPAGGGTPLATALDLANEVVQQLRRPGGAVTTVILTDGRANVSRDGQGGRTRAVAEAIDAAERFRSHGSSGINSCIWIDTSEQSLAQSQSLAYALGSRYLFLPRPTARGLNSIARMANDSKTGASGEGARP